MRLFPLLAFALATAAAAQPVVFFGQDSRFPATPRNVGESFVRTDGDAYAVRQQFLANLASTGLNRVSNESFENVVVGDNSSALVAGEARATAAPTTGAYPNGNGFEAVLVFEGSGSDLITAVMQRVPGVSSRLGLYQLPNPETPRDGIYPTDARTASGGNTYVFARNDIQFDFRETAQTTSRPATADTPVNAFGFYLNDVETISRVQVVLTPDGSAPGDGNDLVYNLGPIINNGSPGGLGNGQLNFIGFIDTQTAYSVVRVGFPGVSGEGFGFDGLVVGTEPQVITTQVTVPEASIADEPGWRLLSAPVRDITVDMLAQQNLVQGVGAGDGVGQQQYPAAASNLYVGYGGGERWDYVPAPSTGTELVPGRGFWWYWYDQDISPDRTGAGGGTSESVSLGGFALTAIGEEVTGNTSQAFDDNTNCASDQASCSAPFTTPNGDPTLAGAPAGTVTPEDDDVYMLGNPYPDPFAASGVSVDVGQLQSPMYIWNPGNQGATNPRTGESIGQDGPGSYEVVYGASPPAGGETFVAPWNGMLAEVTLTGAQRGSTLTFTYDATARDPNATPPFHGKDGPPEAPGDANLALELFGELEGGGYTRDATAVVRYHDEARLGWDVHDGVKPSSPAAARGLLAPLGTRDGETVRQAVLSLPTGTAPAVELAFAASHAGTYTVTWTASGVEGTLVDRATGAETPLRAGLYTFASEATDWTPRFSLSLAAAVDAEAPTPEALVGTPWPNPASGAFEIDVRTASGATVTVLDALGRRVARREVAAPEARAGAAVRVPTAGLAPGAYVVVVEAAGVREARRLTVVR